MIVNPAKKTRLLISAIVIGILFCALRLPGLGLPFHQDEWKNVSASATAASAGQFFAHPPLMQMLFVLANKVFGPDNFRLFPLVFAIAAAFLLYVVVRRRSGIRAALWSLGLFAVCFYNVFGSLQLDVDGAILPFFFLLSIYAYDRWRGESHSIPQGKPFWWMALLIASLLAGLLVKLNFILVIGALMLDYLWTYRRDMLVRRIAISAGGAVGFGAVYIAALYLIQSVYPAFDIHFMIGHASQFASTGGRNWTQIAVQVIKAVYYLSPLLIAPLILASRETVSRMRPFAIYLGLGFIFYFVIFDFSAGALDKYLMFAIVPLAAIAGTIISETFNAPEAEPEENPIIRFPLGAAIAGLVVSVGLLSLNFLPQAVAALYPKTEWFGRVLHGHWNVLTPLTGGSGPQGFYISFLFIAASFIISIALALAVLARKRWRLPAIVMIIIIGFTYNFVFAEELLFGRINGSSADVMHRAVAYIEKAPSVSKVLSYNDIGAHELTDLGKYGGRFYATPSYEEGHKAKFADFRYYMVVDVPHLYENGFYGEFFSHCDALFDTFSGQITGRVYDCPFDKRASTTEPVDASSK